MGACGKLNMLVDSWGNASSTSLTLAGHTSVSDHIRCKLPLGNFAGLLFITFTA
jgi:hypothetical protein